MKPESKAAVEGLTIGKLQGLLLRDDHQRWSSHHAKLKKKAELVAAVLALFKL